VLLALFLVMLAHTPLLQMHRAYFAFGDLRAFYCAARVARAGGDPYRAEPLGACERGLVGMRATNFVVPAPLPGYAIALFEPLARLPFSAVAALWCALLGATLFGLAAALAALTRWAYVYVLAACLPLAFMVPVDQGQVVPLAVLCVAVAALLMVRGRDVPAALLAALSTVEPHLGLPVCAALFIARPRSRPALLIAALAAAGLAVLAVGPAGVAEYAARVLPEHIAAEAGFDDQFSLTYLLRWLHVPVGTAIAAGQTSYWLLAAAGIAVALCLRRISGDERWLLFVPLACSVAGGPYVHEEHLLAAVPLAILVAATASTRMRVLAGTALVLTAWPAVFLLRQLRTPHMSIVIPVGMVAPPAGPLPLLADGAWASRIEPLTGHATLFFAKLPSWLGLALVIGFVVLRAWPARDAGAAAAVQRAVSGV
jgi:hypothetical protein